MHMTDRAELKTRAATTFIALAALLTACRSADGPALPDLTLYLSTDAQSYVAAPVGLFDGNTVYAFNVVTTFTNPTTSAVDFPRCNPSATGTIYNVVSENPSGTSSAYEPGWACVGGVSPIVVPPGGTWVDTVQLRGPNMADGITHQQSGVDEGTLRLRYFPSCETTCSPPDSLGLSNEFTVTTSR